MVQKNANSPQFSNLQRRRGVIEPPVAPIIDYEQWEGETAPTLKEREMIQSWETIPAVFDGVEGSGIDIETPLTLPAGQILNRQQVITALRELAPVEHGLMVEYLYAYYSIDLDAFEGDEAARSRLREAADTVLSVAIDEMRHFRWVNEMLLRSTNRTSSAASPACPTPITMAAIWNTSSPSSASRLNDSNGSSK
ncbi:hypothetical protein AJ88_15855 [Mesorhizobium amorphae CCBAU 01583]|nr:hypothetical protein AJ88_15855 [Mesorhizobium amorphae CCBAU 01583]